MAQALVNNVVGLTFVPLWGTSREEKFGTLPSFGITVMYLGYPISRANSATKPNREVAKWEHLAMKLNILSRE